MKKLLVGLTLLASMSSFAELKNMNSDNLTTFEFSTRGTDGQSKCQEELNAMLVQVKNSKKIIIEKSNCSENINDDGHSYGNFTGEIVIYKY